MKDLAACCTLWCRKHDVPMKIEIAVGKPYRDGELWHCEWSVGDLLPNPPLPSTSDNSLHSMICALRAIATYLKCRQMQGDQFYYGEHYSDDELIERIEDVFWPNDNPAH